MDRRETAAVLAYIGRLDPRTVRTGTGEARDQIDQWQELLDDVPFATSHGWDVREAIRSHVLDSPYPILPVDIARRWRAHRRDRLDRHTDPAPAADPDDPAAWRAELVRSRAVVAAGMAAPATHRQISNGGRPRDVEERVREAGSCIPPTVRAELARYRPTRAAREAAVAEGIPDALDVRCDWCHAPVGSSCRRRNASLDGATRGNAARATPHPSRVELSAARRDRRRAA
ncbi:zinc finger domain-containing protein [Streptomyces massasporeus]|uniref:zinc finger domain-containing protein n=1 Tax=Streptomyces massasporeus TaxID=67324 RepID=UPI00331D723D